jgi:hypothetical protein
MSFLEFRTALQQQAAVVLKNNTGIFKLDTNKNELWEAYLSGFATPELRQEHNCSCCRHFLRDYAGIVVINPDYTLTNLWDFDCAPEFQQSVVNIKAYLANKKIKSQFLSPVSALGTESSAYWKHFYLKLGGFSTTVKSKINIEHGASNSAKAVYLRAVSEIRQFAIDIVLNKITSNTLYRGAEFKSKVAMFGVDKAAFGRVPPELHDNFAWAHSKNLAVAHIRNSAIGTLLVALSEGEPEIKAVKSYEAKVSATNYQRTTATVTARQVDNAEQTIEKLGLSQSILRQLAVPTDLQIQDMLFVDRKSTLTNVFADLKKDLPVDPAKLSNIQEIGMFEFIERVLPQQANCLLLLETKHRPNLFSLVGPQYPDSPGLFKWNNPYSWFYNNGAADSIAERVKKAGGNISGLVRVSLAWETTTDLDLHIHETKGAHIYYGKKQSSYTGATLDVDANGGGNNMAHPVENIIYPHGSKMLQGDYEIEVHNYSNRAVTNTFTVEIEFGGQTWTYHHNKVIRNGETVKIGSFNFTNGLLSYKGPANLSTVSGSNSVEMWGMKTNCFVPVLSAFYSPNYWGENAIGNKHFFLQLEGATQEGVTYPFFNEQLQGELTRDHKRVFEALGAQLEVEHTGSQVSGIGFSTTNQGDFICKLDSNKLIKVIVGK